MSDTSTDQLWQTLDEMAQRGDELLALIRQQRDAVRRMAPEAIRDATAQQAVIAARLRELDATRARLAGAAPLATLARDLPGPARQRAVRLDERIRATAAAIARESAVMRAGAGAMLGHIEGLMRAVARELSHTGAYGPGGTVIAGPQVVSGIDITK
jgi:hypothetical protein